MPTTGVAIGWSPNSSAFAGLLGPILPHFFGIDELSLLFLIAVVLLTVLLVLLSLGMGDRARHVIMLGLIFAGAVGVLTAQHVAAFFAAWEVTWIFGWGIGQLAVEADDGDVRVVPFSVVGVLGSAAMLLGLGLLVAHQGSFRFGSAPSDGWPTPLGAVPYLLFLAIALKTYALLAEGWNLGSGRGRIREAGAVLSGIGVLVVGTYPLVRIFGPMFAPATGWREPMSAAAVGLALAASLAALGESDHRRALAYLTFGQFSFLTATYCVGTPAATQGAIAAALADAFALTGLSLSLEAADEAKAWRIPFFGALFVIASLPLVGMPLASGALTVRFAAQAANFTLDSSLVGEAIICLTALTLARVFVDRFLSETLSLIHPAWRWTSPDVDGVPPTDPEEAITASAFVKRP